MKRVHFDISSSESSTFLHIHDGRFGREMFRISCDSMYIANMIQENIRHRIPDRDTCFTPLSCDDIFRLMCLIDSAVELASHQLHKDVAKRVPVLDVR